MEQPNAFTDAYLKAFEPPSEAPPAPPPPLTPEEIHAAHIADLDRRERDLWVEQQMKLEELPQRLEEQKKSRLVNQSLTPYGRVIAREAAAAGRITKQELQLVEELWAPEAFIKRLEEPGLGPEDVLEELADLHTRGELTDEELRRASGAIGEEFHRTEQERERKEAAEQEQFEREEQAEVQRQQRLEAARQLAFQHFSRTFPEQI